MVVCCINSAIMKIKNWNPDLFLFLHKPAWNASVVSEHVNIKGETPFTPWTMTFTSMGKNASVLVVLWEWTNIISIGMLEAQYMPNLYFGFLFQDFFLWLNFKRMLDQPFCVYNWKFCLALFFSIGRHLKTERYEGLFSYLTEEERERLIGLPKVTTLNKLWDSVTRIH